jgi:hypothetical protein
VFTVDLEAFWRMSDQERTRMLAWCRERIPEWERLLVFRVDAVPDGAGLCLRLHGFERDDDGSIVVEGKGEHARAVIFTRTVFLAAP